MVVVGGKTITFFGLDKPWSSIGDIFDDGMDIVNFLIGSAALVAVAMIILSGYTLMTSAGNPDKVEQGQKMLTGSVIGLIVVLIAGVLVKFVLQLIGLPGY